MNKSNYVEAHSSGILRVAATTDPKKLASAIVQTALNERHGGRLSVRASGAQAVNAMLKGLILADSQLSARGKTLYPKFTFDEVMGNNDSGEVTILVAHLVLFTVEQITSLWGA